MFRTFVGPVVALAMATAAVGAEVRTEDASTFNPRIVFADLLMNDAIGLIAGAAPLPAELELGLRLALEAATIAADDVDLWRAVVQLADVVDIAGLAERGLREVTRLDPSDEVAVMRRLILALDRQPTVEARQQAVIGLVTSQQLPAPMASRIAFDLALVLQRAGDLDGYLEWVTEAVALDPTNAVAVSELAGYFAGTTTDATTQAELLMARCLANPSYTPAIESFAEFLSGRGADASAQQLRTLLLTLYGGPSRARTSDLLFTATATWANRGDEEALLLLRHRQDREDAELRAALGVVRQAQLAMRSLDEVVDGLTASMAPLTRAETLRLIEEAGTDAVSNDVVVSSVAPLASAPSALRAAILHTEVVDASVTSATYAQAAEALAVALLAEMGEQQSAGRSLADFGAAAWLALWLVHDGPDGAARVGEIATPILTALGTDVPAWLQAWVALRQARPDDVVRIASPVAANEPLAMLALALAQIDLGERQGAAQSLLSVARSIPMTVAGVWARRRLERLVGAPFALWSDAAAVDAVAASLPRTLERLLLQPGRELAVSAQPTKSDFGPFERVEVLIEVTNRTAMPLAIATTGPIGSTVAIPLSMTAFGIQSSDRALPMPVLVDIARRIRLEPWETLSVRANLSRGVVGPQTTLGLVLLDLTPVGGHAVIRGRAVTNPIPTVYGGRRGLVEPGLIGSESSPMAFRAMGVEITEGWFHQTVNHLFDDATAPDPLLTAALMSWCARFNIEGVIGLVGTEDQDIRALTQEYASRVSALESVFSRLDPAARAVAAKLISPDRAGLTALQQMARNSDERLVQLAVLTSLIRSPTDPYLDEIRRGDDAQLRRIAELVGEALSGRASRGG